MPRKKVCIIACGGHGSRMGESIPKQFLRIGGKTILQMTLERLLEAVPDLRLVVVLPQDYIEYWKDECVKSCFVRPMALVKGGITRFHSVRNALEKVPDDAVVAVHDAVRPFAGAGFIRTLFDTAENHPAVVPVVPVTDTLKVLDKDYREIPGAVADRSVLFGAQTPQLFHSEILKAAYKQPYDTSFTDDASVVGRTGTEIFYVPGEKYNIKLTTPEDLALASFLAESPLV